MAMNIAVLVGNFSSRPSDNFSLSGFISFFFCLLRSILIDINVEIFLCQLGDSQQVSFYYS